MNRKLIYEIESEHPGYGAGNGTTELYEYECPCGKGKIIEEHDNIPGFREHDVYIDCSFCGKLFNINTINGTRRWKLDGFLISGITNSKIRLDDSIDKKNIKEILINLFEFLSWTFAIREKCKMYKETIEEFFALKDVLDLIKHDYYLIKLNFLVIKSNSKNNNSSSDSNINEIVFGNIDQIENVKEERINRFKKNLENKNLQLITNSIFNDTIKIYNSL